MASYEGLTSVRERTYPRRIVVLGSTGSIGRQTLDVAAMHPDKLEVVGLSCHQNTRLMEEQAARFGVEHVAQGVTEALRLVDLPQVDVVVNALVGAAGLKASIRTLEAGRVLALANKESLVVGGDIIMPLATEAGRLMPIDSEHGAIYQCLIGEDAKEVERLWVTASGGPFRHKTRAELMHVTAKDALAHPTWHMGPKITIDSSTLMNKGLEVIEAHHLFQMPFDNIEVLVQPQSAIHSMVEFVDGSVKAHLGATDMRIPIQYALSWPERWPSPAEHVDFQKMDPLDLGAPNLDIFRCLDLAIFAGKTGGTMPAAMNAANEVAVAAFLRDECGFLDIEACVEDAMAKHAPAKVESVEQLESVDAEARVRAQEFLARTR